MKTDIKDKSKSGIYMIINTINNKVYIGKAKCIYKRIKQHITSLNRKIRDHENDHLINSWHKYGRENFKYVVLEYLSLDEKLLASKELEYIVKYNCLNSKIGYNKRFDSSTGLIVSQETRDKMRKSRYKALENPEILAKCSHTFWKDNPEKCKEMAKKVARLNAIYHIEQYDKRTKQLIKVWDCIGDILDSNTNYKRHNIYAVCSGEKPSMYGYIWKKVLKNDDIVQTI